MRDATGAQMRADLEQFVRVMPPGAATLETLSPTEHLVRWQAADRAGQTRVTALRSGISLMAARVSWERPWSMSIAQVPSALKFLLFRGEAPSYRAGDGDSRALAGATVQVSQLKRPARIQLDFGTAPRTSRHEELSLELSRSRLCELLGSSRLPCVVEQVLSSTDADASAALAMSPAQSRLFDELTHCEGRAASRQLYLEAKSLELLAELVSALEDEARSPRVSQHDANCLELARQHLLARLADPPSLPALARYAGLSETKLKVGFRILFGSPVYAYLRARRMEEAQRLLRERRYGVTEIALRVGYENPSKFAAAFRRHFGVAPGRS
jgi:AraC-like DNA-binding protein